MGERQQIVLLDLGNVGFHRDTSDSLQNVVFHPCATLRLENVQIVPNLLHGFDLGGGYVQSLLRIEKKRKKDVLHILGNKVELLIE